MSLLDCPRSVTKVMPPEMTPPATGTTFVTVFARLSFVSFTPMTRSVDFITGYHVVFVSALPATCF